MLPLQKEKALPGSRFASPEVSFSLTCARRLRGGIVADQLRIVN